jgi:voltage-gated potassium channel
MSIYRRLLLTFCIFVGVVLVGGIGFKAMAGAQHSFLECAYNAFIFVSTVDRPFDGELEESCGLGYRIFTMFLVISGLGTILYGVSTITALIVEGELTDALRRRRMENKIKKLRSHYIVCGVGETGFYIAEELYKIGVPFVVIENSKQQIERLRNLPDMLFVEGDATADLVLKKAGIESASGIILALHSDQDNLFVTLSARQLNPKIKIVAKCIDPGNDTKLLRAGANEVVSPSAIGGLRMVSVMVRPMVVTFLDKMLRDPHETTRIEEMIVREGCDIAGKTIAEARLGNRASILVLAVKPTDAQQFIYRPTPETKLSSGAVVVIMGEMSNIRKARVLAGMIECAGPDADIQ